MRPSIPCTRKCFGVHTHEYKRFGKHALDVLRACAVRVIPHPYVTDDAINARHRWFDSQGDCELRTVYPACV